MTELFTNVHPTLKRFIEANINYIIDLTPPQDWARNVYDLNKCFNDEEVKDFISFYFTYKLELMRGKND